MPHVDADPYSWPYDGDLRPENTVVLVIDMQTDFCGAGGYVDKMGCQPTGSPLFLGEPAGLCIGKVALADGSEVLGVLGEAVVCEGQPDIHRRGRVAVARRQRLNPRPAPDRAMSSNPERTNQHIPTTHGILRFPRGAAPRQTCSRLTSLAEPGKSFRPG